MRRGLALVGVSLALLALLALLPAAAQADRAFSSRFATNTQGDITIAANSLESCLDALAVCANVRNAVGGAVSGNNNNNRTMTWIDVDGDPATFDSSSSDLTLPPGATVLFAGLYYGGRLAAGQGGSPAPNPGARNTVLFKAPGDTDYRSLTASQVDDASTQYQGFVDVTNIVATAGAGNYTTANVQLGTGLSDSGSGGWALVVAYGDPAAPSRNLSVFDGMQSVGSGGGVTIPLSGFQTPLSGPVTSTVGLIAYEGDLGTTGDGAQIEGAAGFTPLTNAANPTNNLFNSTISAGGSSVTSRTPSFQNNLGYDADLFSTNALGNGQTSTQVRLTTSGDAYQPGVVTIATDLYAPRITAEKTVDLATANLGDTLTYTVEVENTGEDGANGTTFSDPLPAGTAFVPGSITVNGAPVSDAAGDDLGEFAGGSVVARLGAGATAGAGGTLAPGASATVSFQVTVATAGSPVGAIIENTADFAFSAATTGVPSTVTTPPATTTVNVPDLAIAKTHSPALSPGQPSTYTVTVGNVGAGPTAGLVTVTDTIEAGLTLTGPATGAGWICSTLVTTITCTRSDPLAAGSDYPPISIPVLVGPGTQPGQLSNTATLQAASDGNPDNNSFTDAGAVSEPVIDLRVEKVVTSTPDITPAAYAPGETITYRITVSNGGIADAANVELTETLDPAITVQALTPSQGTCTGTTCNLGTITNTQEPVTIDVEATLPGDLLSGQYPSGAQLDNTATASAPVGNEINPDDNSASATVSTLAYADISLTKSFSPAQPAAGGPVTYTMNVQSDGPGTVDVVMGDRLPPQLLKPPAAPIEVSITGGTGVCRYDPTGESLGAPPGSDFPVVVCDIPQFGPDEDRVITIQGTLAPDSAGTEVENFAFASTVVPFTDLLFDPDNFEDNTDTVVFTPGTVDVGIEKTRIGTGPVAVGDEAIFELVVTNYGDVPATDVVARDALPPGLTPLAPPPGCAIEGQDVVCTVDSLPVDEERSFEIRVLAEAAAAGRTLTNSATVSSSVGDADGDPADNAASADVTVSPLPPAASPPPPPPEPNADVAVDVGAPSGPHTVGQSGTWEIEVVNNGPATASSVTLRAIRRGARAHALGVRIAQFGCQTGAAVRCSLGDLAPGEGRTVEVRLRPLEAERLTLAAEVSTSTTDTVAENNTDEDSIRPQRATVPIDVRVSEKRLEPGEPTNVVTRIRTRRRPARNARVCVRIPAALAVSRMGGARLQGRQACWPVRRLAANRSRRFQLQVRALELDRPRRVTLTATVRGTGVRTSRARVTVLVRPAQVEPPPVTG